MFSKIARFVLTLCLHGICSSFFLVVNVCAFVFEHFMKHFGSKADVDPRNQAVVITGCDSGFGEKASIRLQRMGFHVIAVCLTTEGKARLKDTVSAAVVADVTSEADIEKLTGVVDAYLQKNGVRLWGVVCNAGIGNAGAVDWISTATFRKVVEVNFFGVVNVTKALLPLLKKNKDSRIVNLSSVAGFLSAPMMAAYDASKHAVEGYAKALRAEMKAWNIHVSNINPGFMKTGIVQNGPTLNAQEWKRVPEELRAQYQDIKPPPDLVFDFLEDPQLVVDDIVNALTDSQPPMWYFPGNQSDYLFRHFANSAGAVFDALMILIRATNPIEPQPRPDVIKSMQA